MVLSKYNVFYMHGVSPYLGHHSLSHEIDHPLNTLKLEAPVNRHAPLKKLSPREIKIKSKPWLSSEILKMIKIRNYLLGKKDKPTMKTVNVYIPYSETELIERLKNLRNNMLNILRSICQQHKKNLGML